MDGILELIPSSSCIVVASLSHSSFLNWVGPEWEHSQTGGPLSGDQAYESFF